MKQVNDAFTVRAAGAVVCALTNHSLPLRGLRGGPCAGAQTPLRSAS